MKKIASIILSTLILLMITGCTSPKDKNKYVVSFGDNLPSYKSDVKFKEIEVSDELAKEYMIKAYVFDDSSKLAIYRWENNGASIEDIMKSEIDKYYPKNYNLTYTMVNEWETKDDFYYGYFMSYAPTGYDRPYYLQNYFFEDGNDIVEAQFWIPAIRMTLPIAGWTIDLPLGYEDGALIKTEITDDAIAKYVTSIDTEFPELNIYKWENVYASLDDYAKSELSVRYKMKESRVYKYTDINGNNQEVLFSIYDEEDEGTMETNYDYTFNIGSDYIEFDFFVLSDDDYVRYAIPALAASIAKNK